MKISRSDIYLSLVIALVVLAVVLPAAMLCGAQ